MEKYYLNWVLKLHRMYRSMEVYIIPKLVDVVLCGQRYVH